MTPVWTTAAGRLPWDPSWFRDVNDLARATPWLHAPLRAFAEYGVVVFALVLLAGWWTARSSGDVDAIAASLWAPLGTLLAVGLNQPIVNSVREARPYTALPHVAVLVSRSSDYSFPSDHAVMAGAVTAGVFLVSRRLGLLSLLAALLMAFTRVYVGAHYPGDVLVGLVLGGAVTLIGYAVVHAALMTRLVQALQQTRLRPLLTSAPAGTDE